MRVNTVFLTNQKATIMEEWVGLRPLRDTVRLEKEIIEVKTQCGSKSKLQVKRKFCLSHTRS